MSDAPALSLLNSSRLENSKLSLKADSSSADLLEQKILWARVSSAALPTWGSTKAEAELWLGAFPGAIVFFENLDTLLLQLPLQSVEYCLVCNL